MSKKHNDGLTTKQRYFKRVYESAPMVPCACGCGVEIKSKDEYARDRKYISGHNTVRKYDDPTQYKREWNHRNRQQRQSYKTKRVHELRRNFVDDAGGKCSKCGLIHDGTNTVIFDFHHRDPATKKFGMNVNSFNTYCLENLRLEAQKCNIICANCHRLHHWDEWNN